MVLGRRRVGSRRVKLVSDAVWSLFMLACLLPCIDSGPDVHVGEGPGFPDFERGRHFGVLLLLCGWCGGNNGVPWSANVVLLAGLYHLAEERPRLAAACGVGAVALGLTTWWARPYDTLLVGYYVWQASLFALAVGAAWCWRERRSKGLVMGQ